MSGRSLDELRPFLISANVRSRFSPQGLTVEDGVGGVGDLVLGEVTPEPGRPVTVLDQPLRAHSISLPTRVVAVLGTRLSSTHVNAGIPEGGLEVREGSEAHWIAGESGLVGRLFFEANPHTPFKAETSVRFRCIGLLKDPKGRTVNIESLAVLPTSTELRTPLFLVSATAAEAGKTVLSVKIIRHLTGQGLRVAAVKVTGTGGTMDSSEHRRAGAYFASDQVDAGLITTYCDAGLFRERILRTFLWAQDQDPDLIVAELGGDLTFANNPTFLRMPEVRENLRGMVVISNDPLSLYGVARYLEEELEISPRLVRHFSSPFRNPAGMKARASVLGVDQILDTGDPGEIRLAVEGLLGPAARGECRGAGGEPPAGPGNPGAV